MRWWCWALVVVWLAVAGGAGTSGIGADASGAGSSVRGVGAGSSGTAAGANGVGAGAMNNACPPADRAVERRGVPDNTTMGGGCAACRLRSEVRKMSLAAIKEHVLAKLGLAHAPNTTGRDLPKTPQHLLAKYERDRQEMEMQADQPRISYYDDEDDYHAKTEKIFAFPHKIFSNLK